MKKTLVREVELGAQEKPGNKDTVLPGRLSLGISLLKPKSELLEGVLIS